MSDTLTIDQIRSKLRAGELFLKEKQGGRSDVWGTSNLQRHSCFNLDNQSKITSFLQKNGTPANVKELIKKNLKNFVCCDLRPFEIVSELVNIDSVYGPLSIDELLPNLQQYHVVHLLLDYYRKISYISLTVHYIDGWSLREQVLAVSKFSDTSHTAKKY
ncbi:4580_t:CDS:2 [Entrophospora sp. SA101]|nr:4580_t:CDS:2 [Entrophospora sp. SA101]